MRFPRGAEIGFNSQVNLRAATREPATAPRGQRRRLGKFSHSKQPDIKCARRVFRARGHGELNVIDRDEWMIHQMPASEGAKAPANFQLLTRP